ncbi:MAG: hypothetical protein KatS3mg131_3976 [Candidatus Tectimicrobiota bacterium]|nr:MAG: hypothetical protein KatS3mg131_3976 [Candidatus Tectomicrobia bacterium]
MPFTDEDFQELIRLIETHPEWRAELRRLLLTDELLALPGQLAALRQETEERFQQLLTALEQLVAQMTSLAEAQRETESRLAALTARVEALAARLEALAARVEELAEAQRETESRLAALTARVEALTERVEALAAAQQQTEARLEALAEAQRETESRLAALTARVETLAARLDALTERVEELAEAQRETESRLAALTARVEALTERVEALAAAQQQTEARLEALAEAQRETESRLAALTRTVQALVIDVGELKGDSLERRYRERAGAYFARLLRRPRLLPEEELEAVLETAVARGLLSEAEAHDVTWADLLVRGRRRDDDAEVVLVVEVSWGVGPHDVEQAAQRAALLSRAGLPALPVVAGKTITPEAARLAQARQVWQVLDGQMVVPPSDSP